VQFIWEDAQKEAFKKLKGAVTVTSVLCYYNLTEEVTLQCDASQTSLADAFLQKGQPVAYASHALTPAETRYAHIVKEVLPIVFACDSFHTYVCGRKEVNIEMDHKPLEPIFMKPLTSASKCLQRMLLHLKQYNLTVKYKRGKLTFTLQTHLAELISRR